MLISIFLILSHFLTALKIFEELKDTTSLTDTYLKLGVVNEETDNLDKALEFFNIAKKLVGKDSLSLSSVTLYNDIGIVYCKKGDFKTALKYYDDGLAKCSRPDLVSLKCMLLVNRGLTYNMLKDETNALASLQTALKLATENNQAEDQAKALKGLATVVSKNDHSKARPYYMQALLIAQNSGLKISV